jgi:hypothetical protein
LDPDQEIKQVKLLTKGDSDGGENLNSDDGENETSVNMQKERILTTQSREF